MPLGVPRMNKRRYAEVVRLLKGVINNPNGKIEQRLRAADTLLSIYDRHDRTVEKRERRLLKLSPEDEASEAVPDKPVEPSPKMQPARSLSVSALGWEAARRQVKTMSSPKIEQLRIAVTDDTLSALTRQDAASIVVKLTHDGVPAPADDDGEVLKLSTPFDRSNETETMRPVNDLLVKMMGNFALGMAVTKARATVHERHRLRSVLSLCVDEAEHRLIRLAACQHVLTTHPQIGLWAKNGYTANKLLESVMKPGSIKQTSTGPKVVERPPRVMGDLWEL